MKWRTHTHYYYYYYYYFYYYRYGCPPSRLGIGWFLTSKDLPRALGSLQSAIAML